MKLWAIYRNLPANTIVRLPHPRSGDSQGQETFLAPSDDRKTGNYNIECSNHHPSEPTLRSKGLRRSRMKWWAIYTNLPVNGMVRLPPPRRGGSLGQETFLVRSADKQTCNYDAECSNHHSSLSTLRSKRLSCSKMKWWTVYTNLPLNVIVYIYIYIYNFTWISCIKQRNVVNF